MPPASTAELTPRQAEILALIRRRIAHAGSPPSVREIQAETGIRSPNGVICHLRALARKGCIRVEGLTARGIRLVVPPGHCQSCGQPLPPSEG
jgi:repressor LexA